MGSPPEVTPMKASFVALCAISFLGLGVADARAQSAVFHCAAVKKEGTQTTVYSAGVITGDLAASQKLMAAWTAYVNKTYSLGLPASAMAPCDDLSKVTQRPDAFIAED